MVYAQAPIDLCPVPHNLDDEARAELLCYLVVWWGSWSHRLAPGRGSEPITLSSLTVNGASCDRPERLELARASMELAKELSIV
jgi:hypothetical protein